jgi:hypothetical protein
MYLPADYHFLYVNAAELRLIVQCNGASFLAAGKEKMSSYVDISVIYISTVLLIHIFIICCAHVLVQVLTASSGKAQKQQSFH